MFSLYLLGLINNETLKTSRIL